MKRACERAGLDPARYAGHCLRSGLATSAAAGGAPERAIMAQGGWRAVKTVRDRYIRKASVFQENAANWSRFEQQRAQAGPARLSPTFEDCLV